MSDLISPLDGKLFAPYFIYLRCAGKLSDQELLNRFGLRNYQLKQAALVREPYAILADDGEWTMIADDWWYSLWSMQSTRPTLASLGESFDVFACSYGEQDDSFDFIYYRDSQLVRKYVVKDPNHRGRVVVENVGEPLPGEPADFKLGERAIVLGIASSLGLKTDYTKADIRFYVSPIRHFSDPFRHVEADTPPSGTLPAEG